MGSNDRSFSCHLVSDEFLITDDLKCGKAHGGRERESATGHTACSCRSIFRFLSSMMMMIQIIHKLFVST